MKTKIILIFAVFLVVSCAENTDIPINKDNLLLGNWINAVYNENQQLITFERAFQLKEESYGISFKEKNIFLERTSGWCATPPLAFFESEGTFSFVDGLIKVSKKGGFPNNSYNWRLVSLSNEKLVVKHELSEQQIDHKNLMELYEEILKLSQSYSCSNSSDWSFTTYGSKACGGPQGYIAYSNKIDTTVFLQKVQEYTKAEKKYNIKWNVVSTCDLPAQPKSVECQNGVPVLKY